MVQCRPKVPTNQVYNGNFLMTQTGDFPDGWLRVGGDRSTVWEWTGSPPGPRAVAIRHPSGRPAGIFQPSDVGIRAGELQRWKVQVNIYSEPSGVSAYLKVYFFTFSGRPVGSLNFDLCPGAAPETFTKVFATPSGTELLCLEVGVAGQGTLFIHTVEACRLHPGRVLRLDSRGRPFVNSVETVGEILKPVRLAEPLPVHVQADVKAELRDLTPLRDGVRIYGSNGLSLDATPFGSLRVESAGCDLQEFVEEMTVPSTPVSSAARDVARYRHYSYAILNAGLVNAWVQVEISPDAVHWVPDSIAQQVKPGALIAVTANYFLRYLHLACWSDLSTVLRIWFQAQA